MLSVQHLGALELADPHARNMRERHLAQILGYVRENGPSSRARIAAECGLGISTMSELIGELRARRLVSESDPVRTQSAGRPLREVRLDAGHWLVGAIHLDEDAVRGKLATLDGRELSHLVLPLDAPGEWRSTLTTALRQLLAARPDDSELIAIEVGLAGHVQRADGWVMFSKSLGLHDVAFGAEVCEILAELSDRPIAVGVDNDCNFASLSVRGCRTTGVGGGSEQIIVYIGGSRYIGGGILVRGQLLRGSHGAAGEFGHWGVDADGVECCCGRRGCLASRAQLSNLLIQGGLADAAAADELATRNPRRAVQDLIAAADSGDQRVLDALTAAGIRLGSVIDAVHSMVNPDQVLIGGYLGGLGRYLEPAIRSQFDVGDSTVPKNTLQIEIVAQSDDAVVDGALASAQQLCLAHPLRFAHGASLPGDPLPADRPPARRLPG